MTENSLCRVSKKKKKKKMMKMMMMMTTKKQLVFRRRRPVFVVFDRCSLCGRVCRSQREREVLFVVVVVVAAGFARLFVHATVLARD